MINLRIARYCSVLGLITLTASGCQTNSLVDESEPTLSDYYAQLQQGNSELPVASTPAQAIAEPSKTAQAKVNPTERKLILYKDALVTLGDDGDPKLIAGINSKIIALELELADQRFNEAPDQVAIYQPVVDKLIEVLNDNPDHPQAKEYAYQLARLQSIVGASKESEATLESLKGRVASTNAQPKLVKELNFRIGEAAFSQQDYDKAIEEYSALLNQSELPDAEKNPQGFDLHTNALYMRAWSYLQLNEFKSASRDFLSLLTLEDFEANNKQMYEDSFRGLVLAVNDAGGMNELQTLMTAEEIKPIAKPFYERMISFYKEEKRWAEIIAAYYQFQEFYPQTKQALAMEEELLEFLEDNDQKASLRDEKARFVEVYAELAPKKAADYAIELAEYFRSVAQNESDQDERQSAYEKSLTWYKRFIALFPDYENLGGIQFAYAETLLESGASEEARSVLTQLSKNPKTSKPVAQRAAYLALTSIDSQQGADGELSPELVSRKRALATAFLKDFPDHPESPQVLGWLLVETFKSGSEQESLELAEQAIKNYPNTKVALLATEIRADSYFKAEDWQAAATGYEALLRDQPDSEKRQSWAENRIKAYYQLARQAEPQKALPLFAKVYNSNDATLAPAALYEAGVVAEKASPEQSQQLFEQLLQRYPKHQNIDDARLKLTQLYKRNKEWSKAAALLADASKQIQDPQLRQTADYEIAELYLKSGEGQKAEASLKAYLDKYQQPYGEVAKAQQDLIEIYERSKRFGPALRLMETYVSTNLSSSEATPSSRKAAQTYAERLAENDRQVYQSKRITSDLQASFKRKQAAMKRAVQSYNRLLQFNNPESASVAQAGIGDLYAELATALMESPAPPGLNELEKEEYLLILEEQALPLEDRALEAHQKNISALHLRRQWNEGIEQSIKSMAKLMPARFDKSEQIEGSISHVQ